MNRHYTKEQYLELAQKIRNEIDGVASVPEDNERYEEIMDLMAAFEHFEPIAPELVAGDSLLREFIGGGTYKYH